MAYARVLVGAIPRVMRMPFLKQNTRRNEYRNMLLCERNLMTRQKIFFSTKAPTGIQYEQLLKCIQMHRRIIIDVRERDEVKCSGRIPGSLNVPLSELDYALENLDDDQFEQVYYAPKPSKCDAIVFYCQNSRRARDAAERATALGYSKINFYIGGWNDWIKHNPPAPTC